MKFAEKLQIRQASAKFNTYAPAASLNTALKYVPKHLLLGQLHQLDRPELDAAAASDRLAHRAAFRHYMSLQYIMIYHVSADDKQCTVICTVVNRQAMSNDILAAGASC